MPLSPVAVWVRGPGSKVAVAGHNMSVTGLRAVPSPPLPVAAMVLGKPVDQVVATLPRIFNLCQAAQDIAIRLALGLPPKAGARLTLRRDILRDHLTRFCLLWPVRLGLGQRALPPDWHDFGSATRKHVFGPAAHAPRNADDMVAFLESGHGVAPVLAAIGAAFGPGVAVARVADVTPTQVMTAGIIENSVAARHASVAGMRAIENRDGRGPLWRSAARIFDIAACLNDALPAAVLPAPDTAAVPAARGIYAVRARAAGGLITDFARITPTDHLTAKGGVLDQCLATLLPERSTLAPLLLEILDPCSPVRLEEIANA